MSASSEKERFETIIEQNKGIIYKIANSYCKDWDDRKDLVQETIIQLWRSFSRYDEQYKLSTWMYRIASPFHFTGRKAGGSLI
jgi:RNA polymerase sigma-70 factor (ECF subfamily)